MQADHRDPQATASTYDPYTDPQSLPFRLRLRRFAALAALIDSIVENKGSCNILDVGGTESYWQLAGNIADRWSNRISITIINLAAGDVANPAVFTAMAGDGCDLSRFPNRSFDLIHSNSVIEHVGDFSRCRAFASEVRRVGIAYWVQTPNRWFPIEPHYRLPLAQFIPATVLGTILRFRSLGFVSRERSWRAAVASARSNRLLNRREMTSLFPDAEIRKERWGGLVKSFIAIRA